MGAGRPAEVVVDSKVEGGMSRHLMPVRGTGTALCRSTTALGPLFEF